MSSWSPDNMYGRAMGMQEPLLHGTFQRFNNNCGYVHPTDPQPHLQAFSHWTYEVTDHMLMVVDVQVGSPCGHTCHVVLMGNATQLHYTPSAWNGIHICLVCL